MELERWGERVMFREWKLAIASSLFQVALIGILGIFVYYMGGYVIGT